ncbi:MAG TPA: glycosyl hydrolase family 28-related protein [Longimicrobiaceae bacterium]
MHSDFGAVGDGSHDDTAAIRAAITAAQPGDTVYFPRPPSQYLTLGMLDLAGKEDIALVGSGSPGGNIIGYLGTGGKAAVSLVGSRRITIRNLHVICGNSGAPPQCGVILGRPTNHSYGDHFIENLWVGGYAIKSMVYNVASEENTWISCYFYLYGGGAKYILTLTEEDDLAVGDAAFPLQHNTCLSNWFVNTRVTRDPGSGDDPNSALIYIIGRYSTGDISFRDSLLGSASGAGIQVHIPEAGLSPRQIILDGLRFENFGAWNGTLKYGLRVTGQSGGTLTGLDLRRMSTGALSFGAYSVYGDDGITFLDCTFKGNLSLRYNGPTTAEGSPSSVWLGNGVIIEGQGITFRQPSTYLAYSQSTYMLNGQLQVGGTPGNDETALLLQTNNSGSLALRRVSVGAPNTGGTGYRILRVPN